MNDRVLVICSDYPLDMSEYGVHTVSSFKDCDMSNYNCLVFHSCTDTDIAIVCKLREIRGSITKLIYINSDIKPLFYCLFTGLDADIYDMEECLYDWDSLKYIIEEYGNTGDMVMKKSDNDLGTLSKSVDLLLTSDVSDLERMLKRGVFTKTLNQAVSNISDALGMSNKLMVEITDVLTDTSEYINNILKGQEVTAKELSILKERIDELETSRSKSMNGANVLYSYSTYTVPTKVRRVLYIKLYGNCRYINSLLLAYQDYLRHNRQKNSILLLCMPSLKGNIKRYESIPRLSIDNLGMTSNLDKNSFYVTYEPKKVVLDTFFNIDSGAYIVIDAMQNDDILIGNQVERFYGIASRGDVKTFNLPQDKCITSLFAVNNVLKIPYMNGYAKLNDKERKNMYYEKCRGIYNLFDEVLGIGV